MEIDLVVPLAPLRAPLAPPGRRAGLAARGRAPPLAVLGLEEAAAGDSQVGQLIAPLQALVREGPELQLLLLVVEGALDESPVLEEAARGRALERVLRPGALLRQPVPAGGRTRLGGAVRGAGAAGRAPSLLLLLKHGHAARGTAALLTRSVICQAGIQVQKTIVPLALTRALFWMIL